MRIVISLCLFLISFSPVNADEIDLSNFQEMMARMAKVDNFAYEGPSFLKGLSIEKVRALGELKDEIKEEVENKYYEGETNPYYTFIFKDGLEVRCRYVTKHVSGPHVQFIYVKITSKTWPISNDLGVGKNISNLDDALGAPSEIKPSLLMYRGETEEVRFSHNNGIITKIEFIYYTG